MATIRSLALVPLIAACAGLGAADRAYTLEAHITGFVGVGGDIAGQKNPTLHVAKGDTVTVTLINAENNPHDIAFPAHAVKSAAAAKQGDKVTVSFTAARADSYQCSVPGHKQLGGEGALQVEGGEAAAAHPAQTVTVDEIGRSASDVPAPITRAEPATVSYRITSKEVIARIEDGTTYEYWTYDGTVPGPMLRARVGDTVEVVFANDKASKMVHSIDFHAATGPGGGATLLQVPPGQERTLRFKTLHPGVYVYHCATPHIPTHLARGMYGLVVVEPEGGLPKVDREFYVMQGDIYTQAKPGTKGHQLQDDDRLFEERPTYVVMNGRIGSLTGDRALKARTGETVRIFFGVGGPNLTSSFHVIGEMFDRVYREADLISPPARSVQTTLVPTGGATVVDIKLDVPGAYLLVDHSLTRLDKGNAGILKVEGDADASVIAPVK